MRMLPLVLLPIVLPAAAQTGPTNAAPSPPSPVRVIDPAATVDGMAISGLPPQTLPAKGCAAFLWTRTPSMTLVAMATTDPTALRLSLDGTAQDYPISAQNGIGGLGFSQVTEYKGSGVTATLQVTVRNDASAPKNGSISDGTLRIERSGHDALVVPVAGAIGCA